MRRRRPEPLPAVLRQNSSRRKTAEQTPLRAWQIIKRLRLRKTREGIYAARRYTGGQTADGRTDASFAYILAAWHAPSRLHRLDCDEIWLFLAGRPLNVYILEKTGFSAYKLGNDMAAGQKPSIILPRGSIFGALTEKKNDWCLFGCICLPAFQQAGCEYITAGDPALAAFSGDRALLVKLTE